MTTMLSHRGPDGAGTHVSNHIGLGHRRLSIIDLDGGAQPLSNENDTVNVVFNGEIYNYVELAAELEGKGHRFRTRSDTEVIVHGYEEWGEDCVNRFNGIFAFALWDESRQRLFLARDHLGVKPLYYAWLGDRLFFASEIKALLAAPDIPREVDLHALGQLFTLRYVPSPHTLFRNIMKLPSGHLMTADAFGTAIRRYWNWVPRLREKCDERELIAEYQDLVQDAVRLQMRSDVPVGLFLSSGIDSGALLAIMRNFSNGPVNTFTIGFEGGELTNETDDARRIAQRFGANHEEMLLAPEDYERYYDRYLWDLEEPVGNEPAAAFYFVSMIARRKVKVVLCGQGADEPWAGYHRYIGVKLSQLYSQFPKMLTENCFRPLVESFVRNQRLRRGVIALQERDTLTRFLKIYSFYNDTMKDRLFQPWLMHELIDGLHDARLTLSRLHDDVKGLDALTQVLYIDTRASLTDDLLMVADKTAMANSLEARVPYLDYRIVQFVESLPPHLKLNGFCGKYLHKKAVERWLPKKDVYVRKKGFANPMDRWLRGRMHQYVQELLSPGSAVSRYFDTTYIRHLLAEHESGRQDYMRHIYLLISFELWHRQFIDHFTPRIKNNPSGPLRNVTAGGACDPGHAYVQC
jgi:asparagine synthase (glutamine-hydrolysing)